MFSCWVILLIIHSIVPGISSSNQNRTGDNSSLEQAKTSRAILVGHWICLHEVDKLSHSRNSWSQSSQQYIKANNNYVLGGSIWINEHMAIGHAQYDVALLQVLRHGKVDRIILQRSPCLTSTLCEGVGTWKSWFIGYYASIVHAFKPGIPIYLRFGRSNTLLAHYLSINNEGKVVDFVKENDSILLNANFKFFETLWRRTECIPCIPEAISRSTVERFHKSALLLASNGTLFNSSKFPTKYRILFAYRSATASRHIGNIDELFKYLATELNSNSTQFEYLPTPESNYSLQIALVNWADILIAEHGAFQSNMMYMKWGSGLLDLRGSYWARQKKDGADRPIQYAEAIATAFGLKFLHVEMSGLNMHSKSSYKVSTEDMKRIVSQVGSLVSLLREERNDS